MEISNHDADPALTVLIVDQNELWHLRQAVEQWCKFLDQDQGSRTKNRSAQRARLGAEILIRDLDRRRNYLLLTQPK